MLQIFTVYLLTCLSTGYFYIGCTQDIKSRWRYLKNAYSDTLTRHINRYGWDNFTKEVIFSTHSKQDASIIEKFLIDSALKICPSQCYNRSESPYGNEKYNETRAFEILSEVEPNSSLRRFYRELRGDDTPQDLDDTAREDIYDFLNSPLMRDY